MREPSASIVSPRTRRVGLGLLLIVSTFSYLDRFAFGALLPAMAKDLKLSDGQLSFVTGGALSVVYVLVSIPIGRFSDRVSRRLAITGSIFAWSLMTALCAAARTFPQLAAARIAIGVGEAGATAPANALIADLFGPRRRAAALSIYALGLPFGTLIGFLAAPLIAEWTSWRTALLGFGIAGVLYAVVLGLLLPDPRADRASLAVTPPPTVESLSATLKSLFGRGSYLFLCLGSAVFTVVWFSLLGWLPTLFVRKFGLSLADTGARLAIVLSTAQIGGLLIGGVAGDRLARRDPRGYLWLCAASSLAATPFLILALIAPWPGLALAALFPAFVLGLVQGAPALAAIQALTGPQSRALAVSTYFAVVNILAGLGAVAVGVLSDGLRPAYGGAALGTALLVAVILCNPLSALSFLAAARRLRHELSLAARPVASPA